MDIKRVGVVGAGQMGQGIAQAVATAGIDVTLADLSEKLLKRAMERTSWGIHKLIQKKVLKPEQQDEILNRIVGTVRLEELRGVDIIIEAVSENESLKQELFGMLDTMCPTEVIFASNTSSIPIARLAEVTMRPERFVGIHFMNPAPVIDLVEIIAGHKTSKETLETARQLCGRLGKTTIEVKDSPGFVVNRIMGPMINEAVYLLQEGVASKEDIDKAMVLGTKHRMGPLALADFVGLDTCLAIMEVLRRETNDPKYQPCPLLIEYVEAGKLGVKTGEGFYKYE
ncbi:MAG: 3-hydroxybutyryl-CoA dehydrogenase [Planctomycetes bacterium]|nr:3-hydroxybutyryl-CoA dehydrogenase [Planctomycetota bacterium]